MLSLDSSKEGIIHVMRGTRNLELLNKMGYRFKTKRKSETFLKKDVMVRTKHSCAGILHYTRMSPCLIEYYHSNVGEVKK